MKRIIILALLLFSLGVNAQITKFQAAGYKQLTEVERDGLTVPSGEFWVIYNITAQEYQNWDGTAWVTHGGGTEEVIIGADEGNGFGFYPFNSNRATRGNVGAGALDMGQVYLNNSAGAGGLGAAAFGEDANASGDFSFASGFNTSIAGYAAAGFGNNHQITGNYGFGAGMSNYDEGENSLVLLGIALRGNGVTESVIVGRANEPVTNYYDHGVSNIELKPEFIVGVGSTSGDVTPSGHQPLNPKDGLRVRHSGRVEAPSFHIDSITQPKDLVTLEYFQDNAGGGFHAISTWSFDSGIINNDPGAGSIAYNAITPGAVTAIKISRFTDEGNDAQTYLELIEIGDVFYTQTTDNSLRFITSTVTSITDNTGWWSFGVTVEDSGLIHNNNDEVGLQIFYGGSGGTPAIPTGEVAYGDGSSVTSEPGFEYDSGANSLSVDNINLPSTLAGEGIINQDGERLLHVYDPAVDGSGEEWFRNLFLGREAGNFSLTTASANLGFGAYALNSLTTALENVGVGVEALSLTTTGGLNTAIGSAALYSNTTGIRNTGFGRQAGVWITSGSNNTLLGSTAGFAQGAGPNLTSIDQAVLIGSFADGTEGSTNEIAIGYQVIGKGSNTVQIGNDNITDFYVGGDYTSPAYWSDGFTDYAKARPFSGGFDIEVKTNDGFGGGVDKIRFATSSSSATDRTGVLIFTPSHGQNNAAMRFTAEDGGEAGFEFWLGDHVKFGNMRIEGGKYDLNVDPATTASTDVNAFQNFANEVRMTESATPRTFVLTEGSFAEPGQSWTIIQTGAGAITISCENANVSINGTANGSISLTAQYSSIQIIVKDTDEYIIIGDFQ